MRLGKRNGGGKHKKGQSKFPLIARPKAPKSSHPAIARLAVALREYKELAEQQAATAEILRVIARSPADVQPVFDAIVKSARRLLGAHSAAVARLIDGALHLQAWTTTGGSGDNALRKLFPMRVADGTATMAKAVRAARPVYISDTETEFSGIQREMTRARGFRSVISVPMLRDKVIGAISVTRREPGSFDKREIGLLKTFADQAVIAIENARLFKETKDALERQTATGEILASISGSMNDARPVFDAIVSNLPRLFGTRYATVNVLRDGQVYLAALQGEPGYEWLRQDFPRPLSDENVSGRAMISGQILQVTPCIGNPATPPRTLEVARRTGYNSIIAAPMIREGKVIGAVTTAHRDALPFDDKQVALIKAFTDQAVIAIENARLFNETKEALERQTTTAEILRVIAASPADTQPVFDAIARSAQKLLGAQYANVTRLVGDELHLAAHTSASSAADQSLRKLFPAKVVGEGAVGRAVLTKEPVSVVDVETDPAYSPSFRDGARQRGYRSLLAVPMLRDGASIGTIAVGRREPGPFSDHLVDLLKTFADQAVIAIENVRLFNETKESLEQQTAIGEVLRVISNSPADVQPVLQAVAERAATICDAMDAQVFLREGDQLKHVARFGPMPIGVDIGHARPLDRGWVAGRAVLEGRAIHIEDLLAVPRSEYPVSHQLRDHAGHRTLLSVPLMREGRGLGAISLRRMEVRPFTEQQIRLVQTFADQAAIAIENVRLFNETQEALEQQTATAEVLSVISGSITDARPVFEAISRAVLRLYGARHVGLYVRAGDQIDRVGYALADKATDDGSQALWPIPLDDKSLTGRTILGSELVHIKDLGAEAGLSDVSREIHRLTEVRSVLFAPMQSMGLTLGVLSVARRSPGGFTDREIDLIRTFADQAVIAMENVRLFREIEEKSRQLETASKHKSQFLASMSHELRTPLNAILGFNEMILDGIYGDVDADVRAPLENIQSSGKHLLRLINNVLDLAKIEAGRMDLAVSDYSVQDTVASVHSTLKPLAAEKRLEFVVDAPADIPLARGDSGRIAQCLMNLAGNSLKFTKEGRVSIKVAQDNDLLRFSVADTGIGIPADKIPHLFTEFKQTDATIASEYGGTGLGLSITKKFIEMHGGRIWVESEPGKGSSFHFEIPLRTAS